MFISLSRNILDQNVADRLKKFSENKSIQKWLGTTFKNWMIENAPASDVTQLPEGAPAWAKKALGKGLLQIDWEASDNLIHEVVDYLNMRVVENQPFEKMSGADAVRLSKEWHKQLAAKLKNPKNKALNKAEDGCNHILDVGNGFNWVELTGKTSLKREGDLMGHCVGSYYEDVKSGNTRILSLRDSKNVPHATVEYDVEDQDVTQIKGKANETLAAAYVPLTMKLLLNFPFPVKHIATDMLATGKALTACLNELKEHYPERKEVTPIVGDYAIRSIEGVFINYGKNMNKKPVLLYKNRAVSDTNLKASPEEAMYILNYAGKNAESLIYNMYGSYSSLGSVLRDLAEPALLKSSPKYGDYYLVGLQHHSCEDTNSRKLGNCSSACGTLWFRSHSVLNAKYSFIAFIDEHSDKALMFKLQGSDVYPLETNSINNKLVSAVSEWLSENKLKLNVRNIDGYTAKTRDLLVRVSEQLGLGQKASKSPKTVAQTPVSAAAITPQLRKALSWFAEVQPASLMKVAKLAGSSGVAEARAVLKDYGLFTGPYLYHNYAYMCAVLLFENKDTAYTIIKSLAALRRVFASFAAPASIETGAWWTHMDTEERAETRKNFAIIRAMLPRLLPLSKKKLTDLNLSPTATKKLADLYGIKL